MAGSCDISQGLLKHSLGDNQALNQNVCCQKAKKKRKCLMLGKDFCSFHMLWVLFDAEIKG